MKSSNIPQMKEIIKKCLPTYEIIEILGEGGYGTVFSIKDEFKTRAVKVIPLLIERSKSYRTLAQLDSKISQEFHVIKEYYEKIEGPGVLKIYDFHLVDKEISRQSAKAHLAILMELCPDNLMDYVLDRDELLPIEDSIRFMKDLAVVLSRLSSGSGDIFLVTDLKPSNLLINDKGLLLIGDLGGFKRLNSISISDKAQFTPNWSAPEVIIKGEKPTLSAMMYSYGLVAYFIWEACLPYEDTNFIDRVRLINEKGIKFDNDYIPKPIENVILQCLEFDVNKRLKNFEPILKVFDDIDPKTGVIKSRIIKPALIKPAKTKATEKIIILDDNEIHPDLPEEFFLLKEGITHGLLSMDQDKILVEIATPKAGELWIEPYTNMEFIWIPGGYFKVGYGAWDEGIEVADASPGVEICLDGFWIGRYPVTQGEWKKVMGDNPSFFKKGDAYPVERVSWKDAQKFNAKLSSLEGGKYMYCLPTETQWEYSARSGGKLEKYSGGDDVDRVGWYRDNSDGSTHPVGEKEPNGLGIYDMSGNVWEWCQDIYHKDAYTKYKSHNPIYNGEGTTRVYRGGSWASQSRYVRCARRNSYPPGSRNYNVGFRIIRTC
ncbi:MAG: SUMF1/EgtB/PvdO family nonheme iron enzyme [Desulfobacterales bacterium]|nr:SUMF1/EgtB/PvdO family nonheme iron enzyme [Desulfobacterales bacterium]